MSVISDFYKSLEKVDFLRDESEIEINSQYIGIIEEIEKTDLDQAVLLNREREALMFVKTAEEGLTPKITGTGTDEDGNQIPIQWPDSNNFREEDYSNIEKRYKSTQNKYLKTEFGLFLFYSKRLKRNEDLLELLEVLQERCDILWDLSDSQEKNYNLLKYFASIKQLLNIASARRKAEITIASVYDKMLNKIYSRHLSWNINNFGLMRFIVDSTGLINERSKDILQMGLDLKVILDKNEQVIDAIAANDPWEIIPICSESDRLANKITDERYNWKNRIAYQYERLAENAPNYNNVAVTFIDKALRIYREIKSDADYERLSQKYQKQRTETSLSEISMAIPDEATERITGNINRLITDGGTTDIIAVITQTPMLADVQTIRSMAVALEGTAPFMEMIPKYVQDKFGNTIESYVLEDEKKEFSFLQHYSNHFQLASQTLIQIIVESIKAGKLSADAVLEVLSKTWVGESSARRISGQDIPISHLKLIEPGIRNLFLETEKWLNGEEVLPDYILSTDSLTLKIEYLLREFCLKLGIVTFKQRPDKREQNIVMEKLFDDLLRDLKDDLEEDNYTFIRFVMSDKMGLNLRNKIAHGLVDNVEYGIESPFLVLSIILKLAHYNFENTPQV
ncbi:hypothetical protein QF042_002948 [Pedobacter sp. W3I1]|uniref:DUF4209 domain-containing protein n=1 Tax=Pedobacter sp. W3I1 TaxID=3042291 RepID=UPI00278446D0|nr:DUF4209 domain-containing protein [Pedobacter sp. W3I1]MDQ0639383.1 hypothetical protein [Pedobacter sp. W3I1]